MSCDLDCGAGEVRAQGGSKDSTVNSQETVACQLGVPYDMRLYLKNLKWGACG